MRRSRNGCLPAMKKAGLKNTTGLEPESQKHLYKVTEFVTFFLIFSIYIFPLYRTITDTMLVEELILLSSVLRKLVILLTNFQVSYSLLINSITNVCALNRL